MKRLATLMTLTLAMALVTTTNYAQMAKLQVIHNSADLAADSVDVYVDGVLTFDNFAFRNASPFVALPAATYNVAVAPKNSMSVADAIATFPLTLMANMTYVVVADGIVSMAGYSPAPAFDLKVYDMGREAASMAGNTDVLVHHGSTDAPTVDVVEVGVGAGTVVDDLPYGEYAGYLELATMDYALAVQDSATNTTVATYDAPLMTAGLEDSAVVVVASGFLDPSMNSNGPAFGLFAALPMGGELIELPLSSASIDENDISQLTLSPNPTNEVLTITNVSFVDAQYSIFNTSGALVMSGSVNVQNRIEVADLESGMYILQVEEGDDHRVSRFIKK